MMFQKAGISVMILFLTAGFLAAEKYSVSSETRWTEGQWVLSVTCPLEKSDKVLPAQKSRAEDTVSDDLKDIIFSQLQTLLLDSRTTVKQYVQQHPDIIQQIYALSAKAHRRFSILSPDMKRVQIQYTIDLYPDIVSLFINHKQPSPIEPLLGFSPSTDFTGIVIYVREALPLFGKNGTGHFTPSLFPRIYDDTMNLLMDKINVDPASIKKWGVAGFRKDLNIREYTERVGFNPLKISARGLFGIHTTDIIIPASDAARVLSRQHNIGLIYSGRIIIVHQKENE